jgi:UDP-N-acetylmuramoyl-tripeptide--D-alanyl-D-alanine ligase
VQALAASVRERYGDSRPTVAITGSCGKTTTRAMVQLVLAALGPVHATQGNLNNHVGALRETPKT